MLRALLQKLDAGLVMLSSYITSDRKDEALAIVQTLRDELSEILCKQERAAE
jgi:hypothetical protein